MQSWPFRIGALVVSGMALYAMACTLLPRTADSVSVTEIRCATVQTETYFACQGKTVFRRSVTDEATVSAIRTTLDGIHAVTPWNPAGIVCNAGDECGPTQVYSFDLLWHGSVVRSYVASVHGGYPVFWAVRTLGAELPATEGSTTWQDLKRLTGMPVEVLWRCPSLPGCAPHGAFHLQLVVPCASSASSDSIRPDKRAAVLGARAMRPGGVAAWWAAGGGE
jgi:hypothetical protein